MSRRARLAHQLTPDTTNGVLPDQLHHACSWCHREQMGNGTWISPESRNYSELVSHTICPTCKDEALPLALAELQNL